MQKRNYKGRCEKKVVSKCADVCRTYTEIQAAYVDVLQSTDDVRAFCCNVPLDGLTEGAYTTDFVCIKVDGDMMVRECVQRKFLTKPMTIRLLDLSREYWIRRGVTDWGLVIDGQ